MQRQAITLEQLADRANLALALWKAARHKTQRPAVAAFLADADARLAELGQRILAGAVPSGRSRSFIIHDPKRRLITAACFADRVLHHAVLNLAEARLEQALVPSSYACRPGKGVHAAVQAVQRGLQRHAWCVQVDVAGYFPSIDHAVLHTLLARRLNLETAVGHGRKCRDAVRRQGVTTLRAHAREEEQRRWRAAARRLRLCSALTPMVSMIVGTFDCREKDLPAAIQRSTAVSRFKGAAFLALLVRIIAAGTPAPPPGQRACGLPIGALTSQHFANAYLGSADRLLLEHPGVLAHVRYMDDIVWFSPSREAAQASLAALREHLHHALHLRLKDGVVLRPSAQGLAFCGHRVRPGVVLPSPRKLARYRAAAQRLHEAEGQATPEPWLQRAHDAALAALAHSRSLHFRQGVWARLPSPDGCSPSAPCGGR